MKIDLEGAVIPEWTLGDRLKKAREHAQLSQDELAAKIGISTSSVSRYEIDKTTPTRPVLLSWAICTNCDLGWLAGQGLTNSHYFGHLGPYDYCPSCGAVAEDPHKPGCPITECPRCGSIGHVRCFPTPADRAGLLVSDRARLGLAS